VYNINGEVIASAVSNLDLHDISRAAKTYGTGAFYVVTPLEDQRRLVERIVSHWTEGLGAKHNPDRCEALRLIKVAVSLDDVRDDIARNGERAPATVVTDARPHARNISYDALAEMIRGEHPYLLVFGTAWGPTMSWPLSWGGADTITCLFARRRPLCLTGFSDYVLAPIMGRSGYNHLSVRSAAAIVLDRLLGKET